MRAHGVLSDVLVAAGSFLNAKNGIASLQEDQQIIIQARFASAVFLSGKMSAVRTYVFPSQVYIYIYGTETHMMKMRHASLNACFRNTALNLISGGIHNDAAHVQDIRRFPYEMLVAPSSSRL